MTDNKLLELIGKEIKRIDSRPLDSFRVPIHNDTELRRYKEGMIEVYEMIKAIQTIEGQIK